MYNNWKFMIKREVVFGREYVKFIEDELMMAIVFKYREPLGLKMLEFSVGEEGFKVLVDLMEAPWEIEMENNGNLRVFNL